MAGVRSDGDVTLFEPRGVPDNMGYGARGDYLIYIDSDHSRQTLEGWVRSGSSTWVDEQRGIVTHPDWHSASWLTTAEIEQVKAVYEQQEFARASWYSRTKEVTLDDLSLAPGSTMEDIIITPGEGHYRGMWAVEIGPKTKAVFPPRYAALLAAMQALGEGARLVFWFDN